MPNPDASVPENGWPTASLEMLKARADLLASIRRFFFDRGVMEVETPLLCCSTALDPHLQSFQLDTESGARYLQTSPEFAMKRLLAAAAGPIYQICKAFRAAETGHRHNPEFTMLEWYRLDFDLATLMDEVEDLVDGLLHQGQFQRRSYRSLFELWYGVNPHGLETQQLQDLALGQVSINKAGLEFKSADLERCFYLDLLMSDGLETKLGAPVFVYDYPACQAALSVVSQTREGDLVARRFELYLRGVELANGYLELRDSAELVRRFRVDNENRRLEGLQQMPLAPGLVHAMQTGLPACCGVALGIDRLLMLQTGVDSIRQVISFPFDIA